MGDRESEREAGCGLQVFGGSGRRIVALLLGALAGLALVNGIALGGSPSGAPAAGPGVVVEPPSVMGPGASKSLLARRARAEALRRAHKLNSSAARRARRRSRTAYRHLSPRQALALAERRFPGLVAARAFNAAHPSLGMTMTRMLGPMSEQVRETRPAAGRSQARTARSGDTGSGQRMVLMMSGMPLAVMQNGGLAPMDLSLMDTGSDFRPKRGMTPVRIGKHVAEGVTFDQAGFSVRMESPGSAAPKLTPAGAFFAGVGPDTDLQVNAAPHGVESFLQLRSPASPEHFALDFTLPPGGHLAPAVTDHPIPNDPPRSVEVQKADGSPAGYVYPPSATDDDGNVVASSMRIEGSRVVIQVSHHGRDLHYPLMVDPAIVAYGNTTAFPNIAWTQTVASGDSYFGQATNVCAYYCGLYESLPTHSYFTNFDYAEYYYQTPPNVYVTADNIFGWSHNPYSTYAFTGLLHPYASAGGGSSAWQNGASGFVLQNQVGTNFADNPFVGYYGFNGVTTSACFNPRCDVSQGDDLGSPVIGLGVNGSGAGVYTGTQQGTSVTADGVGTYLGDRHPPTFTTPNPPSPPWADDGGQGHPINVGVADQGLGLSNLVLSGAATGNATIHNTCTGEPGSGKLTSPCPLGPITVPFNYTLNEGVSQLGLNVIDIAGNSTQQYWTQKIDRTPPAFLSPAGSLYDARDQTADHRNEGLYGGTSQVQFSASDGDANSAQSARSGVNNIDIRILDTNGRLVQDNPDPAPQSCDTYLGSCAETRTFTFDPAHTNGPDGQPIADGSYTIKAIATDEAGNVSSQQFPVTVSLRGDIYHGNAYAGDPATGVANDASDWAIPGSQTGRDVTSAFVSTRDVVSCGGSSCGCSAASCDEVRTRTRYREANASDNDSYTVDSSAKSGDPNLNQPSELLQSVEDSQTTPVMGTGAISDALVPWQIPPPSHGSTYEIHQTDVESQYSSPDQSGSDGHPTSDGETSSSHQTDTVMQLWLDRATKLPLKEVSMNNTTNSSTVRYWTYDKLRTTRAQQSGDFFAVGAPSANQSDYDQRQTETGNAPQGQQTDRQTRAAFTPYFLGPQPTISSNLLCLAKSSTFTDTEGASSISAPVAANGDSQFNLGQMTDSISDYQIMLPGVPCTPGNELVDTPDYEVIAMAQGSGQAQELRDGFQAQGTAIAMDPLSVDAATNGIQPITVGTPQSPSIAYVIPTDNGESAALFDYGATTIKVVGPFSKSDVQQIANLVQPR